MVQHQVQLGQMEDREEQMVAMAPTTEEEDEAEAVAQTTLTIQHPAQMEAITLHRTVEEEEEDEAEEVADQTTLIIQHLDQMATIAPAAEAEVDEDEEEEAEVATIQIAQMALMVQMVCQTPIVVPTPIEEDDEEAVAEMMMVRTVQTLSIQMRVAAKMTIQSQTACVKTPDKTESTHIRAEQDMTDSRMVLMTSLLSKRAICSTKIRPSPRLTLSGGMITHTSEIMSV